MKSGQNPQQIFNALALAASSGNDTQQPVTNLGDCSGLIITFSVASTKGTGTYAASATVLSAVQEFLIKDRNQVTVHDFKTPNLDIPRIAFMADDEAGQGGFFTPDVAITADGTKAYTVILYRRFKKNDFPLKIHIFTAALSALYSTVGTGAATVTVTVTPITLTSENAVQTQGSLSFTLSGLTAINNLVTPNLVEVKDVSQLGIVVTTEGDLTDITLQTPQVDYQSVPTANLKQIDTDTISGHQTGLFRIKFKGTHVALTKDNTTTFKINESTADQPTIYALTG